MNTKTEGKITLREAGYEDIPALAEMAGQAFRDAFTGLMPEEDLQAYIRKAFHPEQVLLEWQAPATVFLIASCGKEWAGYAKMNRQGRPERKEVEKYIELERLYLLRQQQGKKIGAMLMDHCIRFAKTLGFAQLWLNVWEKNTRAIAFYRQYDFEFADTSVMMRGDDPQLALWMKKEL
jgi:GNAT superfamily N-acetyltransferase